MQFSHSIFEGKIMMKTANHKTKLSIKLSPHFGGLVKFQAGLPLDPETVAFVFMRELMCDFDMMIT